MIHLTSIYALFLVVGTTYDYYQQTVDLKARLVLSSKTRFTSSRKLSTIASASVDTDGSQNPSSPTATVTATVTADEPTFTTTFTTPVEDASTTPPNPPANSKTQKCEMDYAILATPARLTYAVSHAALLQFYGQMPAHCVTIYIASHTSGLTPTTAPPTPAPAMGSYPEISMENKDNQKDDNQKIPPLRMPAQIKHLDCSSFVPTRPSSSSHHTSLADNLEQKLQELTGHSPHRTKITTTYRCLLDHILSQKKNTKDTASMAKEEQTKATERRRRVADIRNSNSSDASSSSSVQEENDESYLVLLEDDLLPSPDFCQYMQFAKHVMELDPKVACASAWNDNLVDTARAGQHDHHRQFYGLDASRFYLAQQFAGLGFVMRHSTLAALKDQLDQTPARDLSLIHI